MFTKKPDKEQFLRTLWNQKGTFIPLAELGIHPAIKEQFLRRPVTNLQDEVDFWKKAGYDYIKLQPEIDFKQLLYNRQVESGNSVHRAIQWAQEGAGIINSFADLERLPFPGPDAIDFSPFEQVTKFLPDEMAVIGQYGDIFTMTWELMGFEGFSYALIDQPDLIKAINDMVGELVLSMFEYFAQSEIVDALWYSDDIAYSTGLMVSPRVLEEYFFPWLEQIGKLARKYKKPLIYHSDGNLIPVMERLIACNINALHPIEPDAMDIVELKKQYGSRLCLIGNIDVGEVLTRGSRDDVIKAVRYNIDNLREYGGYCLGSSNSIPAYINFENYLTMLSTTIEYGRL